jgi:hypothetical protein
MTSSDVLSAGITARLEPNSLGHNNKRPHGVSTMPWSRGRCPAWDFTCPDTVVPSHLDKAVTGPGNVANDAEQQKFHKYSELFHRYHFVPIAIETLGAVGTEATTFIQELGYRTASVKKDKGALSFLSQRLSVAVQQGNAACVTGTEHCSGDDCELL